jgi:ABC-type antimicrobial peptide transport system permease subunit
VAQSAPSHNCVLHQCAVGNVITSSARAGRQIDSFALDRGLVLSIRPLEEQVGTSVMRARLVAQLAGFFGGLGVLLAGLGLYGVTSHSVGLRHAEIGIRLAIGAAPFGILRLVLSRVAVLVMSGVVLGLAASLWLSNLVATLLFGIGPNDLGTLPTAVLVLGAVGGIAGWIPASRASRVDPSTVLKST